MTVVLLCLSPVVLCFAHANAAPGDVTTVSAVSGNIATATITNRSTAVIGCKLFGLPAGSVADSGSRPPFGYVNPVDPGALILPGTTRTVTLEVFTEDGPNGSTALPEGVYDLYWGCTTVPNVDGVEQWGTLAPAGGVPTAVTSRLVVPGDAPETPLPAPQAVVPGPCYDARCLPPDLADVVDDLWNELTSP
ncbi:hypothetical protein [Williamsia soli]|uniref:hypothetical protein n=1 Tax=Williamsia soli TaxID=364929 RepID=UPI0027DDA06C|nr:hypothetical protein [Williamsia soli]